MVRALQRGLQSVRVAWDQNLLKLYLQRFDKPDDVIVTIFSEYPTFLLMLAEAYCRIVSATHRQGRSLAVSPRQRLNAARTNACRSPASRPRSGSSLV